MKDVGERQVGTKLSDIELNMSRDMNMLENIARIKMF